MDDLFEEAATEGMEVDPISGNDIPEGVSGKNVRDDVDAKLSEGEFVIPAYAVKFFGVDYFEKLLKKAKKGNEDLAEEGRSEGEGLEMQMGGLVPAAKAKGQIKDGMDLSNMQNPQSKSTTADMLIERGNMTKVDPEGDFKNVPTGSDLPNEMDKPQELFLGGIVKQAKKLIGLGGSGGGGGGSSYEAPNRTYGVGAYDPSNFMSKWNAADYGVGFSTRPEFSGSDRPALVSKVQCPEGYVLDEKQNICVPVAQQKAQDTGKAAGQIRDPNAEGEPRTGDDREGTTGNSPRQSSGGQGDASKNEPGSGGAGFGGNWTSKFDYSDTDALVNQTLTTLGSSSSTETKNDGTNDSRFGNIGGRIVSQVADRLTKGALGTVVGGVSDGLSMRTASIANANAQYLDSIGKKKEAQQIRDAADKYAEDKGLTSRFGIVKDDYNGDQRFAKAKEQGFFDKVRGLVSPKSKTSTTSSSSSSDRSSSGSSLAPKTSVRPQARPSRGGVKSGNSSNKGGYNDQGKTGTEGNNTGGDGSGGYDSNGKSGRAGTWAKGGIVKPRAKTKTVKHMESKTKKSKKGLGRKTK
jgi:hypothetical protein